jgi:hypothetical protein
MFEPEAGQTFVEKLRGPAQQRVRRRQLLPRDATVVTVIVQAAGAKASLLSQGGGPAVGGGVNGSIRTRQAGEPFSKVEVGQDIIPLRRGDSPQQPPYEILGFMESPSSADDSVASAASPDGISAFIARVLDQLTLSAWFPAALLTASVAVLLQFRSDRSANVLTAIRALTADPVRVLVLIVPLLVIATVVTQAFSFEAITTLEGYWRRRGLANFARMLMIRRHVYRKKSIERHLKKASEKAYYVAESRMLDDGIPFAVVNASKARALELVEPPLTAEEEELLKETNWREWSDAWLISKIEHLRKAWDAYPKMHRIMPTRLGNLMRATEDRLSHKNGDVQGFALRRYASAPRLVQKEHDQFRNRLEMYCTLVFVSFSLAVFTLAILIESGIGISASAAITAGFVALSEASYLAAIASAAGYCSALKEMDRELPTPTESPKIETSNGGSSGIVVGLLPIE